MAVVMVLAALGREEALGAERAMVDVLGCGDSLGIIVLTNGPCTTTYDCPSVRRAEEAANCRSRLQALLGEVPPLLVLSYRFKDFSVPGEPALDQSSPLGGFLRAMQAATLLVGEAKPYDPTSIAALGLAARIVWKGLAKRLVVVANGDPLCRAMLEVD